MSWQSENTANKRTAGKTNRYVVKSSRPIRPTLPPSELFWLARPRACTLVSDLATLATTRPAKPMPSTAPTSRCPRSTSTTESDESLPTIMSTNRNNIMIAPVYTMICASPMNGPDCTT